MSQTDTTDDMTDDEPHGDDANAELSFSEGKEQTSRYDDLTKEYRAELPEGGVWVFEFQMLDNEEDLIDKHTTVSKGREGVTEDTDIEALRLDAFVNGVVDAPDGFPVSLTKLKREDKLTRKICKEVGDEVLEFTEASEAIVQQFH